MISTKVFCLGLFFIHLGHTADESPPTPTFFRQPPSSIASTTTGFTVGKQYNLDAKLHKDGSASGSLYAMVGGEVGHGPTTYYSNSVTADTTPAVGQVPDNVITSRPTFYYDSLTGQYISTQTIAHSSSSIWSPSNVNYYVAGGVFLAILLGYGLYAFFTAPSLLKIGADADDDLGSDNAVTPNKETKVVSKKTRRRREIRRNDEASRLVSIVLSAIESGECLEKSICLMGSQIGGSEKGKLAKTVLKNLVPTAIQDNHYFLTLEKALVTGESTCNVYNCKH